MKTIEFLEKDQLANMIVGAVLTVGCFCFLWLCALLG